MYTAGYCLIVSGVCVATNLANCKHTNIILYMSEHYIQVCFQ